MNPVKKYGKKRRRNSLWKETQKPWYITKGDVFLPRFIYRTLYSADKNYADQQNKQRHFYFTGKLARSLSKSIVGWNIHIVCSPNRKILSGLRAQQEVVSASDAVIHNNSNYKNFVISSKSTYKQLQMWGYVQ